MLVAELIKLLEKVPQDAEVVTAYDSMVCVNRLDDVWLGVKEWCDEEYNVMKYTDTLFLCAPSAYMRPEDYNAHKIL